MCCVSSSFIFRLAVKLLACYYEWPQNLVWSYYRVLCVVFQMLYQCNIEKMFVENIAKTIWVWCVVYTCMLFGVDASITLLEAACESEQRSGNMSQLSTYLCLRCYTLFLHRYRCLHFIKDILPFCPFLSNRQHLSFDDCLEVRRENNQNRSMLYSVWQLCSHMLTCEQFLHLHVGLG